MDLSNEKSRPLRGSGQWGPPRKAKVFVYEDRKRFHTKISFGVVLTRVNEKTNRVEAALVKMRYSYAFADFVHGHYSSHNITHVRSLFDRMTLEEKIDILSLDFELMWYRIWLTDKKLDLFNKKLAKFQNTWLREDSGEYLKNLVRESRSAPAAGPRWTLPKGRKQSYREPDINCAVRELKEETGATLRHYRLLPNFKRKQSHMDMGIRYVNIYYAALVEHDNINLHVDLKNKDQIGEVAEVKWMDVEWVRLVDTKDRRLERTLTPVFKYIKRVVKGISSLPKTVSYDHK